MAEVTRRAAFLARLGLWAALLVLLIASPQAQDAPPPPTIAALEQIKLALDRAEAALGQERVSAQELNELRRTIVTARERLRASIEEIEPRTAEMQARLKQLGEAPAKDAPPEEAAVAAEREQLSQSFSQFDGALKQAKLLLLRADQLSDRISEQRRALYAREVFARGASVLDPYFWLEAVDAVPAELRSLRWLASGWIERAAEAGPVRLISAAALLLLILAIAVGITRRWLPRFDAQPLADTRVARARTALAIFIWLAARTPLAVVAGTLVLDAFGLLPERFDEIARVLAAAVAVASFGRGVARALLAPDRPQRRIIAVDRHAARSMHDYLIWSTRAFGVAIVLQVVHKTLYAPLSATVATNALFALAIVLLLAHLARSLRRAEGQSGDAFASPPGARLAAWTVALAIAIPLVAGFAALAAFIALRAVVAAVVFGALYLLLASIDAFANETLARDSPRARSIAAGLGVTPQNLGLVGTLIMAVLRVCLVVLALLLIFGPWEVSTADLADSFQSIPLRLRIGELEISLRTVLAALAVLAAALVITRATQRWLQREFLPRTTLEPSLQLSIATILGYAGAITAIAAAMAALGIDLQKIAFVAGALSVGIGFGLQSIVSNFVSGLILLAERPIRVGDAIIVQGEEGWVRRIRVRATEIETYERASVLIPNSALITGVVKNWTHANTMRQIVIRVGVGYDSDPEQVRDILLAVAKEHPQITKSPAPAAFFAAFGDNALQFEMFCVVSNLAHAGSVKSDLNLEILKRFRAAGIEIPYPQHEIRIRAASSGDGDRQKTVSPGAADT